MNDTSPEMEARYHAMLLARSPEERLRMAGSMYSAARRLVVASILAADPSASPAAIRCALFLRFYGHEFDAQARERIIARLSSSLPAVVSEYEQIFEKITGLKPYPYQVRVERELIAGQHVVIRAPTGAGKTWAVLAPFLGSAWPGRPAKLIYALPLRTLSQSIYRQAREAAERCGHPVEPQIDARGREVVPPYVTLQTGEQPDDPFFDRGTIIVTTYDQVLSGLLDGPYGLSGRLHNINAAALIGAIVVFDEFHLMEPQRAFLTAVAGVRLFDGLCQSVWMTATATTPLVDTLTDALDAVCVPESNDEEAALLASLPSVTQVDRRVRLQEEQLSADAVLRHHTSRSIVLLNTVGRAQAMFLALRDALKQCGRDDVSLILLHSRFFKQDRRAKEERVASLFRRGAVGGSILVATQVIEAGIDISAERLHTELCPMNALVQRAGRCARYEGESGMVHVYPLPSEPSAWLPYGDLRGEDEALTETRTILRQVVDTRLDPQRTGAWIQAAHGASDERALRGGWRQRLHTAVHRIEQNAILRDPKRVADLIRGEDTDSVRLVVCRRPPDAPGRREGVSVSRGLVARTLRQAEGRGGWIWDVEQDEEPWQPIQDARDLAKTYVVCLPPVLAAYDSDCGLRLGEAGERESPEREEPRRPGHRPLRVEGWADHARRVAIEARSRRARERCGLVETGFLTRFGLDVRVVGEAVDACALLHDLGKLTDAWQQWAQAAQQSRDRAYVHSIPLAHTDFDPDSPEDRERERRLQVRRPAHAAASAYYSRAILPSLLQLVPEPLRAPVASACTAAIVAHHGGWWRADWEHSPLGLSAGWAEAVESACRHRPDEAALRRLQSFGVDELLAATTGPDSLAEWWPMVAYLTRILRLSDQRATSEWSCHD